MTEQKNPFVYIVPSPSRGVGTKMAKEKGQRTAETTLQKSLVEDIKATERFNDPAADTTPTFIRTCLPQNQDEGCSSDPNLNLFTEISVLEAEQQINASFDLRLT